MNFNIANELTNSKAAVAYRQGAEGALRGMDAAAKTAAGAGRTEANGYGFALELGAGEREGQVFTDPKGGIASQITDALSSDPKSQKDFMILASNTMSPEAYGKLAEDGYDVQTMDPEETATVVDEIKAEMARSGVVIAGYNDDLSREELEAITGSAVYAAELERAFRENRIPINEENAKEAVQALRMAEQIPPLSDGAKKYLVENGLRPVVGDLYRAAHSGTSSVSAVPRGYVQTDGYLGRTAQTGGMPDEKLTGQMRRLIERAGEEATEENLAEAKRILDLGIPLTEDTYLAMSELDAIRFPLQAGDVADAAARAMSDGSRAINADVSGQRTLLQEAVNLTEQVAGISDEAADAVTDAGLPLTIRNLSEMQSGMTFRMEVSYEASHEASYEAKHLSARRQLEEVRLSMTVEVSYRMLKSGVRVDTTELSKLVEEMKAAEQRLQEAKFGSDGTQSASQRAGLFKDTVDVLRSLPGMPVSLVGDLLKGKDGVTIHSSATLDITLSEYAELGNSRIRSYAAANERYETMMTVPRADLGDNIKEAFDRAGTLLAELGIEADEENLRAARILGYNSMELSESNMEAVKDACRKVRNVTERMTPAATLQMIREGINPLALSMEELDRRLGSEDTVAERFSDFLVRMEQKGEVTEQERASFIGIYRMLHQVEKRDGAAIGSLLAQGAELSFRNLLTAVRSRRDSGMDVRVDDGFAGMESRVDNDIEEQIRTAYYRNAMDEMNAAGHAPAGIYEELLSARIAATPDNVLGLDGLRRERGRVFESARAALSGIRERRSRTAADGSVVTDADDHGSPSPFAVTGAVLEAAMEDTLDRFVSRGEAGEAYEHMADVAERVMADAALEEGGNIDVRRFSSALKQMHTARRLSREEVYELPMRLGGEQSSVSVRILRDGAEQGIVDITMEHPDFGEMHARFTAGSGDGRQQLEGYVVCGSAAGASAAEAQTEQLMMRFSEEGIPVSGMKFVYSERRAVNFPARNAEEIDNSVDTSLLYRTAKTFLQVMAGGEG